MKHVIEVFCPCKMWAYCTSLTLVVKRYILISFMLNLFNGCFNRLFSSLMFDASILERHLTGNV